MIRIEPQPEPSDFDETVRKPGLALLEKNSRPTTHDWSTEKYALWRKALPALANAYQQVCAYSSLWIPPDLPTADHYLPKSANPSLAYEWANYRLARWRVNIRKGVWNVLDPFTIGDDWFVLDFTTFMILPNPALPPEIREKVKTTVERLDLNHQDYVDAREVWFKALAGDVSELAARSPFIAHEARRQGKIQEM